MTWPRGKRARRADLTSPQFPTQQLFVLSLCRICEPIAFMSIFPYVYYMVETFHVTDNKASIATYAGMVTSAFAFAEFSTGIIWGRISDRFGRKPVLLTGLAGTGLSMLMFGLSPNLWTALLARALGGLLNGNIGVINTTVAEVVTHESHQSRAFSIMPGIWCIGSIIGSGLGGTLADPVRNYPGYFSPDGIFAKFPYLLPNIICCAVVVISLVVGFLFLEETHQDIKSKRDYGLELGDWLIGRQRSAAWDEKHLSGEYRALRQPDACTDADYSSTEASPALLPLSITGADMATNSPISLEAGHTVPKSEQGLSGCFSGQVLMIILSYGLLAFHTISADQLLIVLLSLPKSTTSAHLPFLFTGGFEMTTKHIGYILSSQALIQTVSTWIIFPFVSQRFGSLSTFRFAIFSYPLLYLVVPYLTVVPEMAQLPLLLTCVVWKVTAQAFAYPPLQILLSNNAPSKRTLGTLNGIFASAASLARAFGPTLSGAIQSAGLTLGCMGLPWWASGLIAVFGAAISVYLIDAKPTNESALFCAGADEIVTKHLSPQDNKLADVEVPLLISER